MRDLEAKLLSMVGKEVEVEPVLQDISELHRGANTAPDARLGIVLAGSGRGRGRFSLM